MKIHFHYAVAILILFSFYKCNAQETPPEKGLILFIDENVENANESDEKEIIALWQEYLTSGNQYIRNSPYWDTEEYNFPDAAFFEMNLRNIAEVTPPVQNSVLGIFPVEHDHYCLKSSFAKVDTSGQIILRYIVSVYAKKIDNAYKLVSSTQYHKLIWENKKIGNVNYVIHPEHKFSIAEAEKMDSFNYFIAEKFEAEPLEFDYFVTTFSRENLQMMGLDYGPKNFMKVQSGGMAATFENTIYAGNNSAYYPHEVVHLYTYNKFRRQYHQWADEGVAAFFGGSTGYDIDWHIQKLQVFLRENPDYLLNDISSLNKNIPNGEYTTNFMYAIGGYLIKLIYEKEGMQGIFDALSAGREEADYFSMLEKKLGVRKDNLDSFIKKQLR